MLMAGRDFGSIVNTDAKVSSPSLLTKPTPHVPRTSQPHPSPHTAPARLNALRPHPTTHHSRRTAPRAPITMPHLLNPPQRLTPHAACPTGPTPPSLTLSLSPRPKPHVQHLPSSSSPNAARSAYYAPPHTLHTTLNAPHPKPQVPRRHAQRPHFTSGGVT